MSEQSVFIQMPLPELISLFRGVVKEEIRNSKAEEAEEKLLSPAEVLKLFKPKISRGTLHNYCKKGLLPKHKIGGKTVFRYSEVMESMKEIKRYCSKNAA